MIKIFLHNKNNEYLRKNLRGHVHAVIMIQFMKNPIFLMSIDEYGNFKIWDVFKQCQIFSSELSIDQKIQHQLKTVLIVEYGKRIVVNHKNMYVL